MSPVSLPRFALLHCPICQAIFENTAFRRCPSDGAPLRTPDGHEVGRLGEVIQDRYRVERVLGKGGMAQVYEAEHLATNRRVALKIVAARLASDPVAMDRFRREALVMSRITHPNVVAVEDFGSLKDGALFMVMELLRGKSLQAWLAQEELTPQQALHVGIQVCEGVHAAHEAGVVHRDIKPGNVFLEAPRASSKMGVKVLDFGISKLVDQTASADVTMAGTVFGTPEYMSPQQAKGKPADRATDIYSIGVLLFRMLTGRVPFEGETYMEVLIKHITEPVVWPSEQAGDKKLPAAVRDVILRVLDKNPEHRHPCAEALAEDLRALQGRLSTSYSLVSDQVDAVRVPGSVRSVSPPRFRTATLTSARGVDTEIATLAPDVYWVGARTGKALECNTYLRVYRRENKRIAVVIDPGPPDHLHVIGAKIASVLESIADVDMVFINHQDPDVSANATAFQKVNPSVRIICSEDTWRLIHLTGLDARRFSAVERFSDATMRLATGHEVTFVPTPYCHFRGAVMYYDRSSRVLFTGDLCGGLTDSEHLVSRGRQWAGIDAFHQIYMPGNLAVRRAIARIRALDPPPRFLAPQHGTVIAEDHLDDVLTHLESLPMGLDIEHHAQAVEDYRRVLDEVIGVLRGMLGHEVVRERLKQFEGDGSFPDLVVFDDRQRVRDIKIEPLAVAGAVIRELSVGVPADKMDAWIRAIHDVQRTHGVAIPGVPDLPAS